MTQEQQQQKLERILRTRMKLMRVRWEKVTVQILKTLVRIEFVGPVYEKGKRDDIRERRGREYGLTPNFTIDDVIKDQQRKLCEDAEIFFKKEGLDELRDVLV